jgi:uncharacterized protein GlcG (DUF336 family)
VRTILHEALRVAADTRAQIRRPPGSPARVSISVVDQAGVVLGVVRTTDAPPFGVDVSLQKARTAAFFSSATAAADLRATPAVPVPELGAIPFATYVADLADFSEGRVTLSDGVAIANRSVGNLARPFFPDGINGNANGPLSKPFDDWSPFSTGLQLDLDLVQFAVAVCELVPSVQVLLGGECPAPPAVPRCTDVGVSPALPAGKLPNGIQIFPGSVPIYRGETLAGGLGISGDGVDQDDMIAFLGLHNAGLALDGAIQNAPSSFRIDSIMPSRKRVRYVSCPPSPFRFSTENDPCSGK